MDTGETQEIFKKCTCCDAVWTDRARFLQDPEVRLIGYQVNFVELGAGLFLFNHACGTTVSIEVDAFRDLYSGPLFEQRQTGTEACPGFCLHEEDLDSCPARCECAFVREIIQVLKDWRKRPDGRVPA